MRPSLHVPRFAVLVLLAIAASATSAAATPSSTDPSWGTDGLMRLAETARLSFGVASDDVPGGGVTIAGARTNFQFNENDVDLNIRVHPTVQRLLANGQPDTTFGSANGTSTLYLQDHFSIATDIDSLADGRTYVAGTSLGLLSAKTFVARLQPNGALDTTFGAGGSTTILPEAYNAIVPVAVREVSGGGVLVVATSFSGDLASLEDEVEEADDEGDEFDVDEEDRGITRDKGDFDVLLLRLTSAGALDATFGGGDGIVELDLLAADSLDVAIAADIAPDGSAVFAGTSVPRKTWFARALVAKVRPDGSLDGGFGTAGIVAQPSRHDRFDVATDIAPRSGGGYVFPVASSLEDGDLRSYVRRVDAAGAKVTWDGGDLGAEVPEGMLVTTVASLADGRTVVGGVGSRFANREVLDDDDIVGAIARLRASGAVDRSFDRAGIRYVGTTSKDLRVTLFRGLHPAADGTVVATGTIDGLAGALRIRGDASVEARELTIRTRLVRPSIARCGFNRTHPCRLVVRGGSAKVALRFDVAGGGPAGQPVYVRVDRDDDDGYFWNAETYRLRAARGGAAFLRNLRIDFEGSGVHRVQAVVDATATTRSVRGRPFYIRVIDADPDEDDEWDEDDPGFVDAPTRAARAACDSSDGGFGLLAANVRMACDAARRRD